MKYPRIKPELDRRRRFSVEDIKKIKKLHILGYSTYKISKMYFCHISSILYLIDNNYKERRKLQARIANKIKYQNPEYRKRHRILSNESHKYKRLVEPLEKVKDSIDLKNWILKNPERWKQLHEKYKVRKNNNLLKPKASKYII